MTAWRRSSPRAWSPTSSGSPRSCACPSATPAWLERTLTHAGPASLAALAAPAVVHGPGAPITRGRDRRAARRGARWHSPSPPAWLLICSHSWRLDDERLQSHRRRRAGNGPRDLGTPGRRGLPLWGADGPGPPRRQSGVRITATRCEQGTPDPERWPPARLAQVREHELAASLAAVGVTRHRWLGYRDGECLAGQRWTRRPAGRSSRTSSTIVSWSRRSPANADHRSRGRRGEPAKANSAGYATKTAALCDEFAAEHARLEVFMPGSYPGARSTVSLSVTPDDAVCWTRSSPHCEPRPRRRPA